MLPLLSKSACRSHNAIRPLHNIIRHGGSESRKIIFDC